MTPYPEPIKLSVYLSQSLLALCLVCKNLKLDPPIFKDWLISTEMWAMKCLLPIFAILACASSLAFDKQQQSLSPKVIRILNALSLGGFPSESDLLLQLSTSCQNNTCNKQELSQIQEMGLRLVHCQLPYLKAKGIVNKDAQFLCRPQQAVLTCDTLSTPLMRKMCYTGNQHNLKILTQKEARFRQKRLPASQ